MTLCGVVHVPSWYFYALHSSVGHVVFCNMYRLVYCIHCCVSWFHSWSYTFYVHLKQEWNRDAHQWIIIIIVVIILLDCKGRVPIWSGLHFAKYPTRCALHLPNLPKYSCCFQDCNFLYHPHWEAGVKQCHVGCKPFRASSKCFIHYRHHQYQTYTVTKPWFVVNCRNVGS